MDTINNRSNIPASKDAPTMKRTLLMELFENELKDIYWAEQALTKALPKMADNATSPELKEALQNHLGETEEQITMLDEVFEIIGIPAEGKKCEAMAGLIKEGEKIIQDTEEGPQRDAGIISAGQKVEHYEIASYGTLCAFAKTLGLTDVVDLLTDILEQEKNADKTLTEIALYAINVEDTEEQL